MKLVLPWAVLVSDNAKHGGMVGRLTRRYRFAKESLAMVAMGQVGGPRPRYVTTGLHATLDFYPPDVRRRDIGNLLKLISDALQGIVYDDDRYLYRITMQRHPPDSENARVEIDIQEAVA